ncbi:MAG: hypothetical protein RIT04_543 [Candidatus Parcubacteria bacterium]|jgi:tetratricopeptide (TPR) repeat protein
MEKINIPETNSLDSFEGVESFTGDEKRFEPSKEQIAEFALHLKSYENDNDFHLNTKIARYFYDIGHPELASRSALAYFRKQLEIQTQENVGVSHVMNKAYEELVYGAKINNELTRGLGEMLGKLYESSGRFAVAYEYYRESCPDKYVDKLGSVVMSNEDVSGSVEKEDEWRLQIPSDRGIRPDGTHLYFPDFRKLSNRDEMLNNEQKLFADFLKTVPEEVMQIDSKAEFKSLIAEAKEIVAELEKKTSTDNK